MMMMMMMMMMIMIMMMMMMMMMMIKRTVLKISLTSVLIVTKYTVTQ